MSDQPAPAPMFDGDGQLRMRRFLIACASFAVALAAATALLVHAVSPEGGWNVAIAIGAMIGFWMSPLGGAVFGNGLHEIKKERRAEASAH
jgi:opacity protein-like surface antigen